MSPRSFKSNLANIGTANPIFAVDTVSTPKKWSYVSSMSFEFGCVSLQEPVIILSL